MPPGCRKVGPHPGTGGGRVPRWLHRLGRPLSVLDTQCPGMMLACSLTEETHMCCIPAGLLLFWKCEKPRDPGYLCSLPPLPAPPCTGVSQGPDFMKFLDPVPFSPLVLDTSR